MDAETLLNHTLFFFAVPPMSFLCALVVAHLFRWIPHDPLPHGLVGIYITVWAIVWWFSLTSVLAYLPTITYTYEPEKIPYEDVDLGFTTTSSTQDDYASKLTRWLMLPPPQRGGCAQYAYMDAPCGGDPTYERTHGTLPRYLGFNGLTVGVPGLMMWGIMRWELRRGNRKRKKAES